MKNILSCCQAYGAILAAIALISTSSVHGQNVTQNWDNDAANNDFGTATNWSTNSLPATGFGNDGDNIRIDLAGTMRAIYSVTIGTGTFRNLNIGNTATGTLDVVGGTFNTDNTAQTTIGAGGNTGTLNMMGGSSGFGGALVLGQGSGSAGIINLTGGTLISSRGLTLNGFGGVSMMLGRDNNSTGLFAMSGGSFQTRQGVVLGGGTGGTGRFEVYGVGQAGIGSNGSLDGYWAQNSGSTLAGFVDSANGFSLGSIFVDQINTTAGATIYDDGNVIFEAGSLLELGFTGAAPVSTMSWNLMTWEGALTDNGLALTPGTDTNWSFAFVGNSLQVTYTIPEPNAVPLVVAGAFGLLAVRRRRRAC